MGKCNHIEWKEFQQKVAEVFRKIQGCRVYTDYPLKGTRRKNVNADVLVECSFFRTTMQSELAKRLSFKVIVECKYWKRKVPAEKACALREIVSDTGANMGIFITQRGVQKGAEDYIGNKSGLAAITFRELETLAPGIVFVARFGPRLMHQYSCDGCGCIIEVPFSSSKSLLCTDCYKKRVRS
jgi:CxxC-x17-CxxC domain-containing protein